MGLFSKRRSARTLRQTSRRANGSVIGSHVAPRAGRGGRGMNAGSVSFRSNRRASRAVRGEVSNVAAPAAHAAAGVRRTRSYQGFEVSANRSRRARGVAVALGIVLALAAVAGGVASFIYLGQIGSNLELRDSDARSALVAAEKDKPRYALVSMELGAATAEGANSGPDLLAVVRADPGQKTLALLVIPAETWVNLGEAGGGPIRDAARQGDAALVKAVSSLAGVPLSHLVKVDERGLLRMVGAVGGVDADVPEEVDDPLAGHAYLAAGRQHIDADSVLTLLRATNLSKQGLTQAQIQGAFLAELIAKTFGAGDARLSTALLDRIGSGMRTDVSSGDLLKGADAFAALSAGDIPVSVVPGSTSVSTNLATKGVSRFLIDEDAWSQVRAAFMEGGRAELDPAVASDVSGRTVEVRNGAGITGAATAAADALEQAGLKVTSVGNAEQQVFTETLVVYDGDLQPEAEAVVRALGFGRAVKGLGYYAYQADLLVIIGGDYRPIS
ncbi:LCP family protein [Berryella wangjianweii]|uniref:LCP family protein n=1 Tax=Berryella wangjianweii TaxID=2734634 RepID=A0A6M8J8R2_9ACTN|nr:LCP family protein [Berryella wangjianweii]QKF07779.1 LCP family protein [Berryella wangjianweii]